MSKHVRLLTTLMVVMGASGAQAQTSVQQRVSVLTPPVSWPELRSLIAEGKLAQNDARPAKAQPTPELYIRWLQYWAFHPQAKMPSRPPRTVRSLGREVQKAYSELARVRIALEPTMAAFGKEATEFGQAGEHWQLMLGQDILIAPVVHADELARVVKFPAGRWHNLFERVVYQGPGEYVVPATLLAPAVYLREGAKIKARVKSDERELVGDADTPVREFSFARERAVLRNLTVPRFADALAFTTGISYALDAGGTGRTHVLYSELPQRRRARLTPQADEKGVYRFALNAIRPDPGTTQVFRINHVVGEQREVVHDGLVRWMMPLRLTLEQPEDWVLSQGERTVRTRVWNKYHERLPFLIRNFPAMGAEVEPEVRDGWLDPNGRQMWEWKVRLNPRGASSVPVRFALSTKAIYQGEAFAVFSQPLRWVAAGPFAAGEENAHHLPFGPGWRYEPTAVFLDGDQRRRWEPVPEAHVIANNGVNFAELFGRHENAAAYAMTRVRSYVEQQVVLKLGSDDTLAVWVNGRKVFDREVYRTAAMDQETDRILLINGVNVIVAKVAQDTGDWRLMLRLTRGQEQFLTGVMDGFEDYELYGAERPPDETLVQPPPPMVWHVSEPIKNPDQSNIEVVGPLDKGVNFEGDWPPQANGVTWRSEPLRVAPGVIADLGKVLGAQEHVYAYLATTVTVEEETRVRLLVQSADGIVLWLNGRQLHYRNRRRTLDHLPELIRATLKPGENRLLIKLGQTGGDWQMRLNALDVGSIPQRPLGTSVAESSSGQ